MKCVILMVRVHCLHLGYQGLHPLNRTVHWLGTHRYLGVPCWGSKVNETEVPHLVKLTFRVCVCGGVGQTVTK